MREAMIALPPPVTVRCDMSGWSAQQIFSLMILADTQPGAIKISVDHNIIEIASTDFCNLFSAMSSILQAIPDISLKQKNVVPNISLPTPVTGTVRKTRRTFANIFDIRAFKRFAGTIRPQRQI